MVFRVCTKMKEGGSKMSLKGLTQKFYPKYENIGIAKAKFAIPILALVLRPQYLAIPEVRP